MTDVAIVGLDNRNKRPTSLQIKNDLHPYLLMIVQRYDVFI